MDGEQPASNGLSAQVSARGATSVVAVGPGCFESLNVGCSSGCGFRQAENSPNKPATIGTGRTSARRTAGHSERSRAAITALWRPRVEQITAVGSGIGRHTIATRAAATASATTGASATAGASGVGPRPSGAAERATAARAASDACAHGSTSSGGPGVRRLIIRLWIETGSGPTGQGGPQKRPTTGPEGGKRIWHELVPPVWCKSPATRGTPRQWQTQFVPYLAQRETPAERLAHQPAGRRLFASNASRARSAADRVVRL